MAYGPLCQCAFMSYGPRIQQKAPAIYEDRILYDKPPKFEPPPGSEAPPPGQFALYAVDVTEAKADANYNVRYMPLDDTKCVVFGSSRDVDGLVYDGNRGVNGEHTALYYSKGKWFVKAINGPTFIESMTLHSYLRDSDGRPPRRFSSEGGRKSQQISPVDVKKRMTRERCVFRMAESDRIFWLVGPLPLGEGEVEIDERDQAVKETTKKVVVVERTGKGSVERRRRAVGARRAASAVAARVIEVAAGSVVRLWVCLAARHEPIGMTVSQSRMPAPLRQITGSLTSCRVANA